MTKNNSINRYDRKQGNRTAIGTPLLSIAFSWAKLDNTQGQTIKDWEENGLLSGLCTRLQQIGQYHSSEALAKQLIKQYTKTGFPEKSKFKEPKHVTPPKYWAVIHITDNSKEVVAGYIEDNIFYIVFLDKEHHFWYTDIQTRGKNKR
jgi:hypothetical protein